MPFASLGSSGVHFFKFDSSKNARFDIDCQKILKIDMKCDSVFFHIAMASRMRKK